MVVGAIDQGDFEAGVIGEASGAFESGEAAADDEEFAGGKGGGGLRFQSWGDLGWVYLRHFSSRPARNQVIWARASEWTDLPSGARSSRLSASKVRAVSTAFSMAPSYSAIPNRTGRSRGS